MTSQLKSCIVPPFVKPICSIECHSFHFQIVFVRNGDLPKEKSWFLYFVGGCIILEAIFTDVLLYEANNK